MLARAQRWSGGKLLVVTGLCGLGHILSSVLLGFAAVYGGRALAERLGWMEAWRGDVAGWLLFGLGFAYALWGVRVAMRSRPHAHVHDHGDGEIHEHAHDHFEEHAHAHGATRVTFWTLFIIFVLGPCEPLVPIIVAAAAEGLSYGAMALVCGAFGAATVGTMLLVAWLGFRGLTLVRLGTLERYAHALAGGVIAASGAAILWLGL
jgi:ABC-type nickel/cobalt efflux system permease component RcnA